jgi:hypothetical protein
MIMKHGRRTGNWWVENLIRPVLVATMMTCLATPLVRLLQIVLSGWGGTYFLVFGFFAALEGILSERVLQRQRITGWAYAGSRAAEALILVLLLKFANYVPLGMDQLWSDAQLWPSRPSQFFSALDLFTAAYFLLLWLGALLVSRQVNELDMHEFVNDAPSDRTSSAYYLWLTQRPPARDRQRALELLGEMFMWGGIGMLISSALIQKLMPTAQSLAIPTLLFFALGVAVLSQARFSVIYAGWRLQGAVVQPSLVRRWLLWAALFLTGVALASSLLPTEYAMGPVSAVLSVLRIVVGILAFVVMALFFLLTLPLALLFPSVELASRPKLPSLNGPPPELTSAGESPAWLEAVGSALFWVIVLSIVGFAVFRFLRDRLGAAPELRSAEGGWWGRFLSWLRGIWRRWRTLRRDIGARLGQRGLHRGGGPSIRPPGTGFWSLRRLSPRDLVRYFYLSTVRRGGEAGQPRNPGQTPYEYEADLGERFTELEPDLSGLTEAFVRARYSYEAVETADAEAVKPLWQRLKAALRRARA